MVSYAFEKLYADLVTDDGTVCIAYVAWTELLGVRHASAGLELYTPDGRREVIHAREEPTLPALEAAEWALRLDVPGGPFELRHAVGWGPWSPKGAHADLSWSVKSAVGMTEARFLGDTSRKQLFGRGYADWVVLRKPTRRLGLRQVDWGRAHVGDDGFVWNRIRTVNGGVWASVLSTADARREVSSVALDEEGGGLIVTPAGGPSVVLDGGRVLHAGAALDRERFPSPLVRGLARLVSPPMEETRWVRRARVGTREGWALNERVCFGGAT
jgi:hypothetical protein